MQDGTPEIRLSPEQMELVRRQAEQNVLGRLRGLIGTIGGIAAIVGLVGGYFVIEKTVDALVAAQLKDAREDMDALKAEMVKANDDAEAAAAEARVQAGIARSEVEKAREDTQGIIDRIKAEAQAALEANEALRQRAETTLVAAEEAADSALAAATEARVKLAGTEQARAPRDSAAAASAEQLPAARLTENDYRAIRVRQEAERIDGKDPDGRTWRLLTFSVEVDEEVADASASAIFARIEAVDYVFDERWFPGAVRSVTSAATRFSYSVRVFGPTKVIAEIKLVDPPRVEVREGFMNLFGGGILGGG